MSLGRGGLRVVQADRKPHTKALEVEVWLEPLKKARGVVWLVQRGRIKPRADCAGLVSHHSHMVRSRKIPVKQAQN